MKNINWKSFLTSMLIFFAFFTLIAIGMLVTGTWGFGTELVMFYGVGLIISFIFNILNPNHYNK